MNNKKHFNRIAGQYFFLAFFAAICFVAGIPAIVFGAVKDLTFLLVLGIVCTIYGFYGTPLLFIKYGSIAVTKKILLAIVDDEIYSITVLARRYNKDEKTIREYINILMRYRLLPEFILDERGNLMKNEKLLNKIEIGKCPNCNGTLDKINNKVVCPYCGYVKELYEKQ